MTKLTPIERTAFIAMLDRLGEAMSNAGCNDYTIPPTAGGMEMARAIAKYRDRVDPDDAPHAPSRYTMDFIVLGYLRDKLDLKDDCP